MPRMFEEPKVRERRCILNHEAKPEDVLVRLALGPDGMIVPDVAARLPGRGMWVSVDGDALRAAVKDGKLAKAASRSLKTTIRRESVPEDLVDLLDRLLSRRCLDRLGLEKRAGNLVTGFDKIKIALTKKGAGKPALLFAASDGADDGRRKIKAAVGADVPVVSLFDREVLSKALGRENVVHALLLSSGGAEKLKADIGRLLSLRGYDPQTCEAQGNEE
ncbi:DUF448 domain-containing protein [Kordiimonas sp.]|uniref:DUF448 domain-containing protein n=1 Tax=Kordiimonas sp. TaxID=1970157 RepID=UPI003A95B5D1|eukprot:GDKH01004144.1.p1 GENE.GDKH01004144.1~~GDKH01004144.1.p1  ORF type:complete len:219 (+),score=45.63 GDKH01004144.1:140-796(+)